MIWRVAEDEVTTPAGVWKALTRIMLLNIRTYWVKVIRYTAAPHGLAYVKCCAATCHKVDDKTIRRREVIKCVGNDSGRC